MTARAFDFTKSPFPFPGGKRRASPLHSRFSVAAGISWDGKRGVMLGWPEPDGEEVHPVE